MNSDRYLDEILSELAQEQQRIGAPEAVAARLIDETRLEHTSASACRNRALVMGLRFALVLICVAICIAGITYWRLSDTDTATNTIPVLRVVKPLPKPEAAVVGIPLEIPAVRHTQRNWNKNHLAAASAGHNPEVFLALPSSEGLPEPASVSVLQTRIHRDDLRQFGLDVSPFDQSRALLAEFVIGEDGLPRAVRIVR